MTALKWITNEAKKLRREHPRRFNTWKEYIAQASAIYARKHGGKSPVGKKRKKKRVSNVTTRSRTHTDRNRITANIQVGRLHHKKTRTVAHRKKTNTVSHHMSVAKRMLVDDIAAAEARKFTMTKKSDRRKQGKKIAELKRKYRKLC